VIQASVAWVKGVEFEGRSHSGHELRLDGNSRTAASPMELVLVALCGCTAYDVVTILEKKREPLTELAVSAQAEKATEPPRVYTAIHLVYRVRGKVAAKAVQDAVRLSEEKYCSVAAMLSKTARISYEIRLDEE
jgi:putative redox protein